MQVRDELYVESMLGAAVTLHSIRGTGDPYFLALSAFLLQSRCTEITDVCSQIADDVRDEVCPRFEMQKWQQWEIAGEASWGP